MEIGYGRDAVDVLRKTGNTRAVELLTTILTDSKNEYVRREAAEALGQIGEGRAVEPLIAALKDPHKYVRRKVAEVLGQIGDARASEPLFAALKDTDAYMRRKAAEALEQIGDARAPDAIRATAPTLVEARAHLAEAEQELNSLHGGINPFIGIAYGAPAEALTEGVARTEQPVREEIDWLRAEIARLVAEGATE